MALVIISAITATIISVYWFLNRHKPLKHILLEIQSTMDLNGAGAAGILDDWLMCWRNKLVLPDAKNKIAVVTGGGRGIGKEVIRQLLKANMDVIIGLRRPEQLIQLAGTMENGERLHAFKLDLESQKSVKDFSAEVLKRFPIVHLLVNNGGVMFGDYKETEDGYETQFAVNYLSHFYLTHLMLPALKNGGSVGEVARIVNVSSCAHFPGKIHFDDINMKKYYDTSRAYIQSKLAQLMSARYINKLMEDEHAYVRCYSVHPGMVNTELFEKSLIHKYFSWAMRMFFKTPAQGAISILHACFNKQLEKEGGAYISNCGEGFSNSASKNIDQQKRLHNISCDFVCIQKESFGKADQR